MIVVAVRTTQKKQVGFLFFLLAMSTPWAPLSAVVPVLARVCAGGLLISWRTSG